MTSTVLAPPLPFLGALARSPRAEDRLLWLRVAVDFFMADATPDPKLSAEFESHFGACLAEADEGNRVLVARKLLSKGQAPAYLLSAIEALGGDAALYMWERAPGLSRDKLLSAAKNPDRARVIARRDDLDDELMWTIARDGDTEARVALAENARAPLSSDLARALARQARADIDSTGDRRLAGALLARTPPRAECAPLFLEANSGQRTKLLIAAQRAGLGRPRTSRPAAIPAGEIARLEGHALAGEREAFARALARMLDCPVALAERIASDRSGEPLAVALASIGAPNDVCVRILTSRDLQDGSDYRRVGALARLRDALDPSAALRMVEAMVEAPANLIWNQPVLPVAPATPAISPPPAERRQRAASPAPDAVLRRRRAFAFLAANRGM